MTNTIDWNKLLAGKIFEAFDVKTGCLLRAATKEEIAAWTAQPGHPAMRGRFVVGDVAIDERTAEVLADNQTANPIAWL